MVSNNWRTVLGAGYHAEVVADAGDTACVASRARSGRRGLGGISGGVERARRLGRDVEWYP